MQKKFIDIEGLKLGYLEKAPERKSIIFFIHGHSSSSEVWKNQLNSNLFTAYRLIAIDLPAHGDSDACNNPKDDYSPIVTAQILAKAIKQLAATDTYVLVGFSYGTNLIAEMLSDGLNPQGIAFTGACIAGKNYEPEKILADPAANIFLQGEVSVEKAKSFFDKHLYTSDKTDTQFYLNDFLDVNPLYRSFLMQSVLEGKYSDEILALQKQNVPSLIVFGQKDSLIHINYLDDAPCPLWRNTIFKLPETGHFVQTDQPEIFNQLLSEYCIERFGL